MLIEIREKNMILKHNWVQEYNLDFKQVVECMQLLN